MRSRRGCNDSPTARRWAGSCLSRDSLTLRYIKHALAGHEVKNRANANGHGQRRLQVCGPDVARHWLEQESGWTMHEPLGDQESPLIGYVRSYFVDRPPSQWRNAD